MGRMLRELVRSGKSFSGRERNCCYLNTGQKRWANVSALSGLDLPDDGRGVAITDWDHDGDLDVWVVNRSGPQVRFLQNDLKQSKGDFVTLRLNGSRCNRDAIGARIVISLANPKTKLIKTVRAGDGYLSQSSKTVHFGLPHDCSIDSVNIHWPGGHVQSVLSIVPGQHYTITQSASVRSLARRQSMVPSEQGEPSSSPASVNRILLTVPLAFPNLRYISPGGDEKLVHVAGQHRLLNLWATWCTPCISELSQFAKRSQQFRQANVDVLALCVDGLDKSKSLSQDPRELLKQINFPFSDGTATASLVDVLQIIHNHLLDLHQPLPIPCSFLLNSKGQLSAVYKGRVEIGQVMRDIEYSGSSAEDRRRFAALFPGRWSGKTRSPRLLTLALSMLEAGLVAETRDFYRRQIAALDSDNEIHILLFNLAQQLTRRKEHQQAVKLYVEALRHNPDLSSAHYNLAITFLQAGDKERAIPHLQQTVELEPNSADTLLLLGKVIAQMGRTSEAILHFEQALQIRPQHAETHFQLAVLSVLGGELEKGMQRYESATKYAPKVYLSKKHRSHFLAALEHGLRSVRADGNATRNTLSKWHAEIESVKEMTH